MFGTRFFQAVMKGDVGAAIVILILIIVKAISGSSEDNQSDK